MSIILVEISHNFVAITQAMREVMEMEQDVEMLNSVRKATQMGCYGIRSVINECADRNLREELGAQLREYEQIFSESDAMLRDRGDAAKNINPMAKYGSMMSSKMKIRMSKDPSAKVAELMIQGNTRGMMKSIHNLRTMGVLDPKVSSLSNRLLQTEQANIDTLKQYL